MYFFFLLHKPFIILQSKNAARPRRAVNYAVEVLRHSLFDDQVGLACANHAHLLVSSQIQVTLGYKLKVSGEIIFMLSNVQHKLYIFEIISMRQERRMSKGHWKRHFLFQHDWLIKRQVLFQVT
jgi:hypothetical protein